MKMVKAIIESFESDEVKHALTTADIGSFLQPSKRLGKIIFTGFKRDLLKEANTCQ